jgi:hypothetical protein
MSQDHEFPDPRRVVTRKDFGRELTLVKDDSALTVRYLAKTLDIPPSTLGGYFAGTHLPALQPKDLLARLLEACGVRDPATLESWRQAYWRVKRTSEGQLSATVTDPAPVGQAFSSAAGAPGDVGDPLSMAPGTPPTPVSTRPAIGRLDSEPRVRGRDELVATLLASVRGPARSRDEAGVHVLHGLGGCGKSMVALSVAKAAIDSGVRTWWLAADDAAVLATGMASVALELGVAPDELRLGSAPDLVWRVLEALDERWLIIVDNADDPASVLSSARGGVTDGTGWLRSTAASQGTIILTTRDGGAATWGEHPPAWLRRHKVDCLAPQDGAAILLELAGEHGGSPSDAAELSARLGGLPLALMLVGRYLAEIARIPPAWERSELPVSFEDYRQRLDRSHVGILASFSPDRPTPDCPTPGRPTPGRADHRTLDQTWELSLDLLSSRDYPQARPLLQLLACFGASDLPYEELLRPGALSASALFRGVSSYQVWRAIQGLHSVGLVEFREPAPGGDVPRLLGLHPLVRDIARHHPDVRRQASDYLGLATELLTPVVEGVDPKQPATWARWALLSDHCAAPLRLIDELGLSPHAVPPAAIDIANRAVGYLRAAGYLSRSAAAYAQVLAVAGRVFPADDPRQLTIRHDAARLHYDQGMLSNAENETRGVLADRAARLGPEHPDTLATQHQLGRVLLDRGKLVEAGGVFAATYRARAAILGESHQDTLTSRNSIADHLFAAGRHAEARVIYEEVLVGRTQRLGARHPATLVTRHYLAQARYQLGELDGMEPELRALLSDNAALRGRTHPRTLAVGQSLVEFLHDSGRTEEAERLGVALVADRGRVLGDTHPATMASRHRLGLIMLDLGAVAEADQFLTGVLLDRQRVLGPQHPSTVRLRETVRAVQRRRSLPNGDAQLAPGRRHVTRLVGGEPEDAEGERGERDPVADMLAEPRPRRAAAALVAGDELVPYRGLELPGRLDELLSRITDLGVRPVEDSGNRPGRVHQRVARVQVTVDQHGAHRPQPVVLNPPPALVEPGGMHGQLGPPDLKPPGELVPHVARVPHGDSGLLELRDWHGMQGGHEPSQVVGVGLGRLFPVDPPVQLVGARVL